jgi:Flp pilus assembly protein CpaB
MTVKRPPTILISGLVLGLLGAALVFGYVRSVESRAGAGEEMTTVMVASAAIPTGTAATDAATMATAARVPARYARPGSIAKLEAVAGQFTVRRVEPGETLSTRDFASAAQTAGALAIPAGREAVAVAVPLDGGVGRYPRPGDKVSVYATFKEGVATTHKLEYLPQP